MLNLNKSMLYTLIGHGKIITIITTLCLFSACDGDSKTENHVMGWTPISSSSSSSSSSSGTLNTGSSSSSSSSSGSMAEPASPLFHDNWNTNITGHIENGSFENGSINWFLLNEDLIKIENEPTFGTDELANFEPYSNLARDGEVSLIYTKERNTNTYLAAALYNLETNNVYEVSAWVTTTPDSPSNADISLTVIEQSRTSESSILANNTINLSDAPENATVLANNEWQMLRYQFNAGEHGQAWVLAFSTSDNSSDILIDHVQINTLSNNIICTTEIRNALEVTLNANTADNASTLCQAQVIATSHNNSVFYLSPIDLTPNQCVYTGAPETSGTYTINVNALGYTADQIENLVVGADDCHVRSEQITINLQPAASTCPDGYSWQDKQCETRRGCAFPLFEEPHIPGIQQIDPVTGDDITQISYTCVESCINYFNSEGNGFIAPEQPGICPALVLP